MNVEWRNPVSRRPLLTALGTLAGAGIAGGLIYKRTEILRHRAAGPYAGLLLGVGDPASAAVVGRAVLAQTTAFDTKRIAHQLRDSLGRRSLTAALTRDAERGDMTEVRGWVLPETLVLLCGLAAETR